MDRFMYQDAGRRYGTPAVLRFVKAATSPEDREERMQALTLLGIAALYATVSDRKHGSRRRPSAVYIRIPRREDGLVGLVPSGDEGLDLGVSAAMLFEAAEVMYGNGALREGVGEFWVRIPCCPETHRPEHRKGMFVRRIPGKST